MLIHAAGEIWYLSRPTDRNFIFEIVRKGLFTIFLSHQSVLWEIDGRNRQCFIAFIGNTCERFFFACHESFENAERFLTLNQGSGADILNLNKKVTTKNPLRVIQDEPKKCVC